MLGVGAARAGAGGAAPHGAQHGEQGADFVQDGRIAAAGRLEADHEVLADGQIGENVASLRHIADASPATPERGPGDDVPAVGDDASTARAEQADEATQQRGLAGAVPAEQRQALALLHVERHAAQALCAAVMMIQSLDCEIHGQRPR